MPDAHPAALPSLTEIRALDAQDPLRQFRDAFHLPLQASGEPYLYFCGNSLGLQPRKAAAYIQAELEDWARLGVEGHVHARNPWLTYHEQFSGPLARLAGALPEEVVAMNGLSVNLHLLMVSFYRPTKERFKILIEGDAFPSDSYAVASQAAFHGLAPEDAIIRMYPRPGEYTLRTEDLLARIGEEGSSIALVLLGGVNYYTGQYFDIGAITRAAQAQGCMVGWDLAHAIGNVPLDLHGWNVDFACWCSYKYLNSGPGGVAGAFIHQRHLGRADLPRFAGWWGHDKASRFRMPLIFRPIPTAEAWQLSNAPVLQMAALRASLELFDAAGMEAIRAKSLRLTGLLVQLLKPLEKVGVLHIITPQDPAQRGCQLSLVITYDGRALFARLQEAGVICDWREPDVIRVAPAPLYNTFEEVWQLAHLFARLLRISIP